VLPTSKLLFFFCARFCTCRGPVRLSDGHQVSRFFLRRARHWR
jgi:hypothetical protein